MSSSLWNDYVQQSDVSASAVKTYEDCKREIIKIWRENSKGDNRDGYELIEGRFYSIGNEKTHLCTQWCNQHPSWCNRKNLLMTIDDIFAESSTGKVHICSHDCEAKHIISEGFSTCPISGLQYTQTKYVNSYRTSHEYHRTSNTTVRVQTSHIKQITEKLVQDFLFSNTRRVAERKKEWDVTKEIKKSWMKRKRTIDKKNKPSMKLNALELITSAIAIKKRKILREYRIPDVETQKIIVEFYVERISSLWMKLKSYTDFQNKTNNNTGIAFVCALLYLMRTGLTVDDVIVIPKDRYLESALPEANSLDLYNVNKTHFSGAKNEIYGSLRDSIHSYYINPYLLVINPF